MNSLWPPLISIKDSVQATLTAQPVASCLYLDRSRHYLIIAGANVRAYGLRDAVRYTNQLYFGPKQSPGPPGKERLGIGRENLKSVENFFDHFHTAKD